MALSPERSDYLHDSINQLTADIAELKKVRDGTQTAVDTYTAKLKAQNAEIDNYEADLAQKKAELNGK